MRKAIFEGVVEPSEELGEHLARSSGEGNPQGLGVGRDRCAVENFDATNVDRAARCDESVQCRKRTTEVHGDDS